ncbi:chloroplast outer envelope protein 37, ARABIDOPSIS CHLOROPLAST OUTER ENVELOPE PROTEIN 37 [Hibiscus trionum]|uniref:Chloroplast outer envelope protein 37, ARABIDOPSIS CHLOROPLAST OUTER ENVELOPE PROTEIN 37 n=1 Tax=Hibiscus trionum TaxID=183268 RepID=A0A9W7LVC3_HIBTR|nr:chloroplast outer envelope protein 37, ARABIDOPSIS CHLOROPLAST OUTER ENVELOPE PROTEIN 37 [Hibiscus trionum]
MVFQSFRRIPNHLVPPLFPPPPPSPIEPEPEPPPPPTAPTEPNPFLSSISSLRVTSEFDSDSRVFFHKLSCKVLDNLAKLKLSFINNSKREITEPQLALFSKHLSVYFDPEEKNAIFQGSYNVDPTWHLKAALDIKAQQGEVAVIAKLADPSYVVEVLAPIPDISLPKATFRFPVGEVSLAREGDDVPKFSLNGIVKGPIWKGVGTARYSDEELKLRYSYKDGTMSVIPSISLPTNSASFAFKRRFSPLDKLSYWYSLDTNYWSAVYKHTYDKDMKFKAGYDSEVRLCWASLWVGNEKRNGKSAPMRMKIQFMLQVPQDDIKSTVILFRVKKRFQFPTLINGPSSASSAEGFSAFDL